MVIPQFPLGRSIRSAICIAGPLGVGWATGSYITAIWIVMGTLVAAAGESGSDSYGIRLRSLAKAAPIAAAGYLTGYLTLLPYPALIAAMTVVGFGAGVVNSLGASFPAATMQFLLTAALGIGLSDVITSPYWQISLLYLSGIILYAAALFIEAALKRSQTQLQDTEPFNPGISSGFATASAGMESTNTPFVSWAREPLAIALCVGISYSARYWTDDSHWFWIPLTVALVMTPRLGSVYSRSIGRICGTVIGVIIGILAVRTLSDGTQMIAGIATLALLLPWARDVSYAAKAVIMTPLILIIVDLIQPDVGINIYAWERLTDTITGGLIVIIIAFIAYRSSRSAKRHFA
ncbi:FUSC family protein [Aureimonas fodinaquatilis]|uniref:FUSC family protein n=1 Tax=Aureimonas fodinaquatilis TaxID=2565783 RepID=A0A5B0E285_9HYPH|nr:FUSC family protein [Aureimonas fodinaquatilis]KAA0971850.1 FUSC family protein [Aureimonas fodinaquatilis]